MKPLAIFCLVISIVGCTAEGPLYQPAPSPQGSKALVYFIENSAETMFRTDFCVDGTVVASLYKGGYSWAYLDPGVHFFGSSSIEGCSSETGFGFKARLRSQKDYLVVYRQYDTYNETHTKISLEDPDDYRYVLEKSRYTKNLLD